MDGEIRDISGDLRERADLLVRHMVAEQARFRTSLSTLENGKAIRRQRLEAALQAVHRAIHIVTVRHALLRGLKSAVAALDAQAEKQDHKVAQASAPLTQRKSEGTGSANGSSPDLVP